MARAFSIIKKYQYNYLKIRIYFGKHTTGIMVCDWRMLRRISFDATSHHAAIKAGFMTTFMAIWLCVMTRFCLSCRPEFSRSAIIMAYYYLAKAGWHAIGSNSHAIFYFDHEVDESIDKSSIWRLTRTYLRNWPSSAISIRWYSRKLWYIDYDKSSSLPQTCE